MSGIALVVVLIAQAPSDPIATSFERAARGVLGEDARIEIATSAVDPSDDESVQRASGADGVVELSWSADRARIHCWVTSEKRWVEREISFGAAGPRSERETRERGRLLGLAVATMFGDQVEAAHEDDAPRAAAAVADVTPPPVLAPPPQVSAAPPTGATEQEPEPPRARGNESSPRGLEVAATASSGLGGTAAGVGALAALRLAWSGPLWTRFFVAGRAGSIPVAQANTRSLQLGSGLALSGSPGAMPIELGARLDLFASYFDATHLSEDDVEPDRKSRWLPGADLVLEGGVRVAPSAGLFVGAGLEAVTGRTDIYTHGQRVAVVPVLRIVGEAGFRARF